VRLGAGGRQAPIELGPCRATRTKLSALRLHRHQESAVVGYWPGGRWRCPRIETKIESAVLRTTIQIVLSERLTINVGRLRFSRRRVTYPRPLWTQIFSIKRVASYRMEAAGITPASREALVTASTRVAGHLCVSLEAPIGKVPFGLFRHKFNSSRNRRLGSSDPTFSSPAAPRGQKHGARPLLFFRQRDGDQQCCWQFRPIKRL
jgi:hypothetical protein